MQYESYIHDYGGLCIARFHCCMAGFDILQTFPSNKTYCCHCPSLRMQCNFPEEASFIWWSIPDKAIHNIPAMYPHHEVDSRMSEGVSELTVTNALFLEERYRCIVFFPNGSSIDSNYKSYPPPHSKCSTPSCPACTEQQTDTSTHLWRLTCIER